MDIRYQHSSTPFVILTLNTTNRIPTPPNQNTPIVMKQIVHDILLVFSIAACASFLGWFCWWTVRTCLRDAREREMELQDRESEEGVSQAVSVPQPTAAADAVRV